ncbi:MAG: CDP-alcohol phosphatidyltransferase family protein [Acidobacteria bacterium]|nr:CDP-alcohol phosphatidyltransferase family protein [Acidobacteriota bacterium]MCY4602076.1 CDP-alcohol phosphatidyltransferase family protein [Acidobacteriota bacterium]
MATLTLANQLTLVRLLLVPVLVILVIYGRSGWALITFILAGVTDGLDGIIARRSGGPTSLGALLDPMADKLLLVSTFVVLTLPSLDLANRFPIWLTVLVISRDVIIVLTVAVVNLAVERFTFPPSHLGKVATFVYILTGSVTLLFNYLDRPSLVVEAAIWASLAVTLASGFHYIFHAARLVNR